MLALTIAGVAVFFAFILCLAMAYRVGRYFGVLEQRIFALEQKTSLKRLPNKTIEGLEDAQAVLIGIAQEHQITGLRLQQLDEVLKLLRSSPFDYQYRPDGSREKKEA